ILSPSWKSMARLVLLSRLELKRPEGSLSEAPLAKVNWTTFLYVSPVQIIPACDHTGTPAIEFDGFFHFTSSTTSGSACLMSIRIRASISPRQSLSSLILASISREGESPPFPSSTPLFVFFMVVAFFMVIVARQRHPAQPSQASKVRRSAPCRCPPEGGLPHGSASAFWHGPGGIAIADSCNRVNQCIERSLIHGETPLPILGSAVPQHDFTVPLQ